jgi:hypothetical protein
VWDAADIPSLELFRGKPSGSACPLVWAHAEYVKLRRSLRDGKIFDQPPQTVQRYLIQKHERQIFGWRFNNKCRTIPRTKRLRLVLLSPAMVRWTLDGWQSSEDTHTRDTGLGIHTLDLPRSSSHSSGRRKIVGKAQTMASRWSSSAAGRASFEAHREKAQLATILAEGPGHELDPNSASFASDLFGCIRGSTWRICCHGNPDHADWTYIADTHWPVVFNRPACRSIFHGAVLRVYGGGRFARLADQTRIPVRVRMRLQPDRGRSGRVDPG